MSNTYTVKSGDTLGSIAGAPKPRLHHALTVQQGPAAAAHQEMQGRGSL